MGAISPLAALLKLQTSPTTRSVGVLNIAADSMAYDMQHLNRGKCLVINHQKFDLHTGCNPRKGSEKDAMAVSSIFQRLGFEIIHMMDWSYRDIQDLLVKVSKEDHTHNDCLVVVMLTHGEQDSLWARDRKYPIEDLYRHFNGDRCPSLIGKPKIFIIQACRGTLLDSGTWMRDKGIDVTDGLRPVTTYKIPLIADFLLYYSTAPGHYSFRNTEYGSYFIQTLTRVLQEYCLEEPRFDLVTLLTMVNRKVAFEFESYVPDKSVYDGKKQIPCIQSMLTRLVFLTPKSSGVRV